MKLLTVIIETATCLKKFNVKQTIVTKEIFEEIINEDIICCLGFIDRE